MGAAKVHMKENRNIHFLRVWVHKYFFPCNLWHSDFVVTERLSPLLSPSFSLFCCLLPFYMGLKQEPNPLGCMRLFLVWGEAEGPRIATVVDGQFRAVRLWAYNPPTQNHNLDTMNKQTAQVKSQGFRRRSGNKVFLFSFSLEACVERGEICHPTNRRRKGEKDVAQFCTGWMQGFRQPFFAKGALQHMWYIHVWVWIHIDFELCFLHEYFFGWLF